MIRCSRVLADLLKGLLALLPLVSIMWLLATSGLVISAVAAEQSHVYLTWEGIEPDKGASAWLIKRHIDTEARFETRPYGEELIGGISFDVPESRFRRTHRFSTFETLVSEYKITDSTVIYLGTIIHDIEINTWGQKRVRQTPEVEYYVNELRQIHGEKTLNIDCYISLFDEIYKRLQKSQQADLNIEIPAGCKKKI